MQKYTAYIYCSSEHALHALHSYTCARACTHTVQTIGKFCLVAHLGRNTQSNVIKKKLWQSPFPKDDKNLSFQTWDPDSDTLIFLEKKDTFKHCRQLPYGEKYFWTKSNITLSYFGFTGEFIEFKIVFPLLEPEKERY